jgi:streptomycin 6-kinase
MTLLKDKIPTALVTHILAVCGERGEEWLQDLPNIIAQLEGRWSIIVADPFPAIEFNFVAPAVMAGGEAVVLKIAPPFDNNEIESEADWLREANSIGAVALFQQDRQRRAILLERALPGKNLAALFDTAKLEAIGPAISVLRDIVRPASCATGERILLSNWFDGLRRYVQTDFPSRYARKALDLFDNRLNCSSIQQFYLHGDFHPGNVVSARRAPYLAIDPKGIIGPLGYDIAVFLNNFHWWQESEPDVRASLAVAIERFSEAFEIEPLELRQWAFAQMVLGAWWTYDEMPLLYDNEVAKADIWDV